jgi:hypothetical protein
MCEECLEDLSRVAPVEVDDDNLTLLAVDVDVEVELDELDLLDGLGEPLTPPTVQNEEVLEIVYPGEGLKFRAEDGQTFSAAPGDVVGRAKIGSDVLQDYPTVSRLHFRLARRGETWLLINLSDNGTWVNGQEALSGQELPLAHGDELLLSSKCRLRVLS